MGTHKGLSEYANVIGFDYGTKRIGVCVGQMITCTASPLPTLQIKQPEKLPWQAIDTLIRQWQPQAFVVGWPLMMDDSPQWITDKVEKFIEQLTQRFKLPVFKTDERLTTKSVKEDLFNNHGYQGIKKAPIDSLAAVLLLTQWMKAYVKASLHND